MKLRFRPDALRDLEEIQDYIADDNPYAGRAKPELHADLRSFPARRYIILYRLADDTLEIVNMIHGSRDIDAML